MKMLPPLVPQQTREETLRILATGGISSAVAILGVRGYYLRTMGDAKRNDRGIYDDAIFIVSKRNHVSFNANCDPSVVRDHVASLRCGVWLYQIGIHGLSKPKEKQYTALVQAGQVTVDRDGKDAETGFFGINIHRGGYNTTSSLGCQTIYPDQWPSFISIVRHELDFYGQKTVPYMLTDVKPEA